MASPTATADYQDDRQFVIDELAEFGYEAGFGNTAAAAAPDEPDGDYVEEVRANVLPIPWNKDFSEDVQKTDKFFFVDGQHDICVRSYMEDVDGKIYKLCKVEALELDGQTRKLHEIQCRAVK